MTDINWKNSIFEKRSSSLELLNKKPGETVQLAGWTLRYRDQGGLIFIDLRDREGIIQIVFDRSVCGDYFELADSIRSEFVLAVEGDVRLRAKEAVNSKLPTGTIEVVVRKFEVLNRSAPIPFELDEYADVGEEHRLRYRYLDLRRDELKTAMIYRSRLSMAIRRHLEGRDFLEIETPILNKSTPEGARDFLVPSRLNPGNFYALPQSPQLFKQILMTGGMEKYFQIAKCFRDEDLRADRQPEFTQLDMELSFVNETIMMNTIEELLQKVFAEVFEVNLPTPFPRMAYRDAIETYGNDRPDTRYELHLIDIGDIATECDFKVFREVAKSGGRVKALAVPGGAVLSRKEIDDLTNWVSNDFGAKGLAWLKHEEQGLHSVISKFFAPEQLNQISQKCQTKAGDIIFFAAADAHQVHAVLGNLRIKMAERFKLIPENSWAPLWINEFPLFERDPDSDELYSVHHPFTAPREEDLPILQDEKRCKSEGDKILSRAYDVVLNGVEIGGGSIRIHDSAVQSAVFKVLGIDEEEARQKFGFLLEALQFGTPPHGGIAFGLDRILMIMLGRESIRDVIAFPKTQKGHCLMSASPSTVAPEQLRELRIRLLDQPKESAR